MPFIYWAREAAGLYESTDSNGADRGTRRLSEGKIGRRYGNLGFLLVHPLLIDEGIRRRRPESLCCQRSGSEHVLASDEKHRPNPRQAVSTRTRVTKSAGAMLRSGPVNRMEIR
jgi:hypothetical protein